jgi:hypothetical protein
LGKPTLVRTTSDDFDSNFAKRIQFFKNNRSMCAFDFPDQDANLGSGQKHENSKRGVGNISGRLRTG